MASISAGLLMYNLDGGNLRVFLVHPGGPYFRNKNKGWWTIPKGLPDPDEALIDTAIREFNEETGLVPEPPFHPLGAVAQKGGKTVHCWGFEGRWEEESGIKCNTFQLEWPPKSGNIAAFPEIDQAKWMLLEHAFMHINERQQPFLERLKEVLG